MKNRTPLPQRHLPKPRRQMQTQDDNMPELYQDTPKKASLLFQSQTESVVVKKPIKDYWLQIVIASFVVLALIVGLVVWLRQSKIQPLTSMALPGHLQFTNDKETEALFARTEEALETEIKLNRSGTEVGGTVLAKTATWNNVEGEMKLQLGNEALCSDQLLAGMYYLQKGETKAYQSWETNFLTLFLDSACVANNLQQNEGESTWQIGSHDFRSNCQTLRLLILADQKWPNAERQATIRSLTEKLYEELASGIPALHRFTVGLGEQDTWYSSYLKPTPIPAANEDQYIALADLDLWTVKAISQFDNRFLDIAKNWENLLQDGIMETPVPLIASGVMHNGGYVYGIDNPSVLLIKESCLALRHLAEIGTTDASAMSFLENKLTSQSGLTQSVGVVSGDNVGESANPNTISTVMALASASSNKHLWMSAKQALAWYYAASQTNPAQGMYYRYDEAGKVVVFAQDNLAAAVALQKEPQ